MGRMKVVLLDPIPQGSEAVCRIVGTTAGSEKHECASDPGREN